MSNLKIPNLGIFPRETYTNNQNKYHDILQFLIILKFYSQNELKTNVPSSFLPAISEFSGLVQN